jgi:predicted transcriptional regulator
LPIWKASRRSNSLRNAALRIVADDSRFLAGVRRGLAQADRDEFIEEAEMDTRVKRLLER